MKNKYNRNKTANHNPFLISPLSITYIFAFIIIKLLSHSTCSFHLTPSSSFYVNAAPAIVCGPYQTRSLSTFVFIKESWSTGEGCRINADSTEEAENLEVGIGLVQLAGAGFQNVTLYRTTFNHVQLQFQFPATGSSPLARFALRVDGCTFRTNRWLWNYFISFSQQPPVGSTIIWSNNTFDAYTTTMEGAFSMITFTSYEFINVTVAIVHNRFKFTGEFVDNSPLMALSFGIYKGADPKPPAQLMSQNTSIIVDNNIFDVFVYEPAETGGTTYTKIVMFNLPLILRHTSGLYVSNNIATVNALEMVIDVAYLSLLYPTVLQDRSAMRMSNCSLEGIDLQIASMLQSTGLIMQNLSSLVASYCRIITTFTSIPEEVSNTYLSYGIVQSFKPLNTTGNISFILSHNNISIVARGVDPGAGRIDFVAATWRMWTVVVAITLFGSFRIEHNFVSLVGTVLDPDERDAGSIAGHIFWNEVPALILGRDTRIVLHNNVILIDVVNPSPAAIDGQLALACSVWLNVAAPLQINPNAGLFISNERHQVTVVGLQNTQSRIILIAGLVNLTDGFIWLSNVSIVLTARTHDGRGPYDPLRAAGNATVAIVLLSESGLFLSGKAFIKIEHANIVKNSTYTGTSVTALLYGSGGTNSFRGQSSISIANNTIVVYVGGETPAKNYDVITFFMVSTTTPETPTLTSSTFDITNNTISVDKVQPGTGISTLHSVSIFSCMFSGNDGDGRLNLEFNLTLNSNIFRSIPRLQGYSLLRLEGIRLSLYYSSTITLKRNHLWTNETNMTGLPMVSLDLSSMAISNHRNPFIRYCHNYRNGFTDETVSPTNFNGSLFPALGRDSECTTESISISVRQTVSDTYPLTTSSFQSQSTTRSMSPPTASVSQSTSDNSKTDSNSHKPTRTGSLLSSVSTAFTLSGTISAPSKTITNLPALTRTHLRTVTVTTPSSISFTQSSQIPESPSHPAKDAREESETVVGPILGSVGVLSPRAGGQASVAMAALRLSERCTPNQLDNEDDLNDEDIDGIVEGPLSPFIHPLHFSIGSGKFGYYMGAVVGNCLIIPLFAAGFLRFILSALIQKCLFPDSPNLSEVFDFLGWPFVMILIAPALAEGTATAGVTLITSGESLESLLGIFALIVTLGVLLLWLVVLFMTVKRSQPELERAPFPGWFCWPLAPLYERVPSSQFIGMENELRKRSPLYGDSAWMWAGCLSYGCGLVVGTVEGVGHRMSCGAAFPVLLVFAIIQSFLACTTLVPGELLVEVLTSVCLILLCSSATVAALTGEGGFLTSEEENILGLLINILGLFGLTVGAGIAAVDVYQCRAVTLFRKKFGVKHSSYWAARKQMMSSHQSTHDGGQSPSFNTSADNQNIDLMGLFLESIHNEVNERQQAKQRHQHGPKQLKETYNDIELQICVSI